MKCLVDIIATPEYHADIDWPQVLCKLGLLCFDDNLQLRKILFYLINQKFNQLKRSFVVLFYYLSMENKDAFTNEIRKTLAKYSENFWLQYLKSIREQKVTSDLARSPQYDIIYLLFGMMNHPLFLFQASSWRSVWKLLNHFYDLIVLKDSCAECHDNLIQLVTLAAANLPHVNYNISEYTNSISIARFRPPKFGVLELDMLLIAEPTPSNARVDTSLPEKWKQLVQFTLQFFKYKLDSSKVKIAEKHRKPIKEEILLPRQYFTARETSPSSKPENNLLIASSLKQTIGMAEESQAKNSKKVDAGHEKAEFHDNPLSCQHTVTPGSMPRALEVVNSLQDIAKTSSPGIKMQPEAPSVQTAQTDDAEKQPPKKCAPKKAQKVKVQDLAPLT